MDGGLQKEDLSAHIFMTMIVEDVIKNHADVNESTIMLWVASTFRT